MPPAKQKLRLASKYAMIFIINLSILILNYARITAILEDIAKEPVPAHQRHVVLEVCVEDSSQEEEEGAPEPEVGFYIGDY